MTFRLDSRVRIHYNGQTEQVFATRIVCEKFCFVNWKIFMGGVMT